MSEIIFSDYAIKQKIYSFLFKSFTQYNINNIIIDIFWIKEEIDYVLNKHKLGLLKYNYSFLNNNYNSLRYKDFLKKIKMIINIYLSLNEDNLNNFINKDNLSCDNYKTINPYLRTKISSIKKYYDKDFIFIKHPEFLLDIFFYHNRFLYYWNDYQCENQRITINNYINELIKISYIVFNIFDELHFDVTYYSTNNHTKIDTINDTINDTTIDPKFQ